MKKFGIRYLLNAGVFSQLVVMDSFGGMIGFVPVAMPLVPLPAALCRACLYALLDEDRQVRHDFNHGSRFDWYFHVGTRRHYLTAYRHIFSLAELL